MGDGLRYLRSSKRIINPPASVVRVLETGDWSLESGPFGRPTDTTSAWCLVSRNLLASMWLA